MSLIAPSILSADFGRLAGEIADVEAAGADWIHADVMDGHFVPNITFGPMLVGAVRQATALPIDVHLMIEQPDRYVQHFAEAGANWISVQVEACVHLNRVVQQIKNVGCKAGVVLNPATPLTAIEWVLDDIDYVLIMSVNPGFGGQSFIPNSLKRIEALRRMIDSRGLSTLIEIDGGVNADTIRSIASAGADVYVAGSAIFGSSDYERTIHDFKALIREAAS